MSADTRGAATVPEPAHLDMTAAGQDQARGRAARAGEVAGETAGASTDRAPAAPFGAIILTRHGEPALSRRCRLTSEEYRAWWQRYEVGGLLEGQIPPACLVRTGEGAGAIFASSRPRAIETARAVAGKRSFEVMPLFVEAPLPPPRLPDWFRTSPRLWGAIARFSWWAFDHHQGEESRREAEARAEAAADHLVAHARGGGEVLLFAHGYFNHMIGTVLKRRGWKLVKDQGFKYWSARRFELK
jgi:broad specificity phosphatase PhoE